MSKVPANFYKAAEAELAAALEEIDALRAAVARQDERTNREMERVAGLLADRDIARENMRAAWVALRMIREAVEQQGVGLVAAAEHLDGPTAQHEAEAIIAGVLGLAREKTSAEQERDGANRVVAEAGLRLRGAEQEIARLREIVVEMDGELRLARAALGDRELADTLAHINYAIGDAERALAAAAGAEEPRSARPISEQTQAELKALDEAAGMGRHRLRGFLTGKAEEPR